MNKNNLKEIVAYIQKSAVDFGGGGKGGSPFPLGGSGGSTGGTVATYVASSNNISEMQKAIQEFADAAVAYKQEPIGKEPSGKIIYQVKKEDKRRDFNDFLAEQFMASADIHGDEYTPDKTAVTRESKLPTDIVQLDNVIDGLRRIGPAGNEKMKDGVWDFRTNNAVRNVYAFAASLVTAHEALGGIAANNPNIFTRSDLAQLKSAMPVQKDPMAAKVPQAELNEKAKAITPLVQKLTEFYKIYSSDKPGAGVLGHPAYKQYINQDFPLYTFKPGGTNPYKADPSDPDQKKFMDNPASFTLPKLTLTGKGGKQVVLDGKITLQPFQSVDGIVGLMTQYLGYSSSEVNNPKLLAQIVRSILTQVRDFIEKNNKLLPPRQPVAPIIKYDPRRAVLPK